MKILFMSDLQSFPVGVFLESRAFAYLLGKNVNCGWRDLWMIQKVVSVLLRKCYDIKKEVLAHNPFWKSFCGVLITALQSF